MASSFEPWGLVVNEAMAAGLPVIATERVGCVDDLVVNGETGLVILAESTEILTDSMQYFLQNESLRHSMASNARNLIDGWTLENEANNIVSAWKKVSL